MANLNDPAQAEPEAAAASAESGPPDRSEAHFMGYGPSARPAVMAEYNRTLRVHRDTGVVDARQRADYTDGEGGRGRGQALYNANREAVAEIRRWQAGTWEPPALEEENQEEGQISETESSRESVADSDAAEEEAEYAEDASDIWQPGISETEFAQARERLDRLKQRLARIERGEPAAELPQPAGSSASDTGALIRGVQVDLGQRSRLHSYHPTVPRLDIAFAPARLPEGVDTERLLNALIGECHFLMQQVAFRSMCQTAVLEDRMDWVNAAMRLATTGAKVAKSVARLRHGLPVKETHHSMTIENKLAAVVQGGGGV